MTRAQPLIPSTTVAFPALPSLTLHISGVARANGLEQEMQQGFHVEREGTPLPRCEQTDAERQAVLSYLLKNFPEHAMLILGRTGVLAAKAFITTCEALDAVNKAFAAGQLSSVEHSRKRESALCEALVQMAQSLGCDLELPISIDSRGELRIVTKGKGLREAGSGQYGLAFSEWLNTANPRTGVQPGAHLLPESGWCYLNHFEAERLVQRYAATFSAASA